MMPITGPKISSCASRLWTSHAVEDGRPEEVAAVAGPAAAGEEFGALLAADAHVVQVGLELLLADGGAHLDAARRGRRPR